VPLTVGDIPNSSYREEELMVQNLMQASGSQDPAEAIGGQETATGVMAVQQAQAVRVSLAIRRAELELVGPVGRDFAEMNRQHLVQPMEVPVAPTSENPEPGLMEIGPEQLVDADFDVFVAGGLRPDNTAQDRADATNMLNALGALQGVADPRQLAMRFFELMGEKNPELLLAPAGPKVPPQTLDYIKQAMVAAQIDPTSAQNIIAQAYQQALAEDSGQPGIVSPNGAAAGQNGGPPVPQQG
jgi:methylmalonyl-CoA mutase cobalamin-binding subunit